MKRLKTPWSQSLFFHAALVFLVALMLLGHHSDAPVDANITIEDIFHQAIHRIGIPHREPFKREESLQTKQSPPDVPLDSEAEGGSGSATELQKYFLELLERIHRTKKYPKDAQFNEQEGLVQVLLEIAPDGQILRVELEKECPFPSLNQAGLEAVRDLGRLAPLPKKASGEPPTRPISLHIPIHFKLK